MSKGDDFFLLRHILGGRCLPLSPFFRNWSALVASGIEVFKELYCLLTLESRNNFVTMPIMCINLQTLLKIHYGSGSSELIVWAPVNDPPDPLHTDSCSAHDAGLTSDVQTTTLEKRRWTVRILPKILNSNHFSMLGCIHRNICQIMS